MRVIGWIAFILLLVGGINWGLVGVWGFDLVFYLFGDMTAAAKTVYILVGVAALWELFTLGKSRS